MLVHVLAACCCSKDFKGIELPWLVHRSDSFLQLQYMGIHMTAAFVLQAPKALPETATSQHP